MSEGERQADEGGGRRVGVAGEVCGPQDREGGWVILTQTIVCRANS